MKKLLLIFILTPLLAQSPIVDELKVRVYNFEKHYDKFFRKLFGCPEKGYLTENICNPGRGIVSYHDYEAAKKEARKLFP
ncbi:hypothetical protein UFOVP434_24 [uncultured Caudovirales phage]|uniref:Uncharacterized protein n=1 Tax=uncultured Caudovirales phage TaxID=2100421 RepID=A0A6J5M8U0_9CAUD|nr:hypothetical protein UFOVP434_24 [uncultured Caudovirales phage]